MGRQRFRSHCGIPAGAGPISWLPAIDRRDAPAALRAGPLARKMNEALQRLADYLGVMPSYVGYDGAEKHTSPETQRAILRAMGVDADTDDRAAEILTALQDE